MVFSKIIHLFVFLEIVYSRSIQIYNNKNTYILVFYQTLILCFDKSTMHLILSYSDDKVYKNKTISKCN